ncbi:MAG: 23S rRNA (adenine(2503)-C(2))-methyltransferase RlmN [Eubacteriales bacterium]|nr:23S rRNA (adenine(2503)-C(2))-methyltransferase RlmN [Eubacteriales bacterium]MDD4389817.1 23S rRNA (adenine(2503)-C(2))-methyltransferase RlmN [Eubacteriales bacterium]
MKNFKDMGKKELGLFFEEIGEKKFRAAQVYAWMMRGIQDFKDMTDLSESLRERLSEMQNSGKIALTCAQIDKVQSSTSDGTRKYLLKLLDGNFIESVFMKYKYGNSVCISSQVGCKMGCIFCASAIGGHMRNLTSGEMLEQLIAIERDTKEKINHIVVMGTGEPFDNFENLAKFLRTANDEKGLGISMRNITVSTCGLIPGIKRFAEDFPNAGLAISLHAPNNEIRNRLLPINKSYPLEELMSACKDYTEKTGRRITFEYALIKGINDSLAHADELANLLYRGLGNRLCHVNLIPLNEVSESGFSGSGAKHTADFHDRLTKRKISSTIRRKLGADIDAACGQLRMKTEFSKNKDNV